MITLNKIIKEEKRYIKKSGKIPSILFLNIKDYEDLKSILGYEPKSIHGMKIVISAKNAIE